METRACIEILIASAVPITIIGLIINRIKSGKGLGVRAIQFLAVSLALPIVSVLAMEKVVEGGVVGTIVGAVLGYLLSNISNYDKSSET